MKIRITTLCENTAGGGYLAEWGLSMLVEVDGLRVLFDTGPSTTAAYNAQLMGIDLASVDRIVLSHGHADHTGGLRDVLRRAGRKEIFAHPAIWGRKYGQRKGEPLRYIGLPFIREGLEALGAEFKLSDKPVKLAENVMTTGEVPLVTDYEAVESNLYVKDGEELRQDNMPDDLAMIIDTDFGLVVILGCGHRGIVNTLRRVREVTSKDLIYAAIGGTHLLQASEERLHRTAEDLQKMGVQRLGVSHCTGFRAAAYLVGIFGDAFFMNNAGTCLTLPFEG